MSGIRARLATEPGAIKLPRRSVRVTIILGSTFSTVEPSLPDCEEEVAIPVTSGIWTKCSSRSTAARIISGERSIRTALSLTFAFNPSATDLPQCGSFANCWCHGTTIARDHHRQTTQLRGGKRVVMPSGAHRQHRYLNNRAENSHQPTRERERRMRRFQSARHAQRFVEVHGIIASHFRPRRHLLSAADYRRLRSRRFQVWNEVTGATALA